MTISLSTNPEEKDAKAIKQGIIDFNQAAVPGLEPNEDEVNFFVFVRDKTDAVIGGIKATCFWNTLHIELFWLSKQCRGQGVGKRLITTAENYALENACDKAFVETTSWQARPFYEKMGYTLMASLNDRPKGHASHYLTKKLKEQ